MNGVCGAREHRVRRSGIGAVTGSEHDRAQRMGVCHCSMNELDVEVVPLTLGPRDQRIAVARDGRRSAMAEHVEDSHGPAILLRMLEDRRVDLGRLQFDDVAVGNERDIAASARVGDCGAMLLERSVSARGRPGEDDGTTFVGVLKTRLRALSWPFIAKKDAGEPSQLRHGAANGRELPRERVELTGAETERDDDLTPCVHRGADLRFLGLPPSRAQEGTKTIAEVLRYGGVGRRLAERTEGAAQSVVPVELDPRRVSRAPPQEITELPLPESSVTRKDLDPNNQRWHAPRRPSLPEFTVGRIGDVAIWRASGQYALSFRPLRL